MKEKIKSFILETFMPEEDKLEYDEQLFESGLIDSLGFIKLVQFIEKEFNIQIDMSEVTMEKFGSINDIEQLITEKSK